MKQLLTIIALLVLGLSVQAQSWIRADNSFDMDFTRVTTHLWSDSVWVYDGGNSYEWTFVYNAELLVHHSSTDMLLGVMMLAEGREEKFFLVYVGGSTAGDGFQAYDVDVLRRDSVGDWKYISDGLVGLFETECKVVFGDYMLSYE